MCDEMEVPETPPEGSAPGNYARLLDVTWEWTQESEGSDCNGSELASVCDVWSATNPDGLNIRVWTDSGADFTRPVAMELAGGPAEAETYFGITVDADAGPSSLWEVPELCQ